MVGPVTDIDKTRQFRTTGFIFTGFFVAGIIVNLISVTVAKSFALGQVLVHPNMISIYVLAALSAWSALVPRLRWIQPAMLLVAVPIPLIEISGSMYGIGAFVIASMMLFQLGYLNRKRKLKVVALLLYLLASQSISMIRGGMLHPVRALAPVLFTITFIILLFILNRERIVVYLREPKPRFSLGGAGLSRAEAFYVRQLVDGKTLKEISSDSERQESTVRNTLARAYRKLGVADRSDLISKLAKYEIVE